MNKENKKYNIAVIGAGNGGHALAGFFAMKGHYVNLYARNPDKIAEIREKKSVTLKGCINGKSKIKIVSDKLEEVLKNAEIIMIVTTADAHSEIAKKIVPLLSDNQIIVLNPGRTLGAFEFGTIIRKNSNKKIIVVEAQSLIFACRLEAPGTVKIIGCKDNVIYSTFPSSDLQKAAPIMKNLYAGFKPVANVIITGLENFGAIFHTTLVLSNLARIEKGEKFYFYNDVTPKAAELLMKIDKERQTLAESFGVKVKSAEEWISYAYKNIKGETLFEKMKNNPAYYEIEAPQTLYGRYLLEDIPTGILPMIELAKIAKTEAPLMRSVYNLAGALLGIDFREKGRTLKNLGLENSTAEELLRALQ